MRRASSASGSAARAASAALVLLALGHAAPRAHAGAAPVPIPVRVLSAPAGADPSAVIDALEAAGFRVHVALLPSTYYASAPGGDRALPAGVRIVGEAGPLTRGGLSSPGTIATAAPTAASPATAQDPFGGRDDAIPPDPAARPARALAAPALPGPPAGLPYGALWEDTSEFLIGRVVVPLLFPESDGTVDRNHFDWTPALRDSVVRAAVRGFLKWSLFAASRDIPLTFLIETHAGLATRYEPIDRTIAQETLWIGDALEALLGYRGDAVAMAYEFANAARARRNAQWATLAFAVQNDTLGTGSFPDGYIAHARLGGPYFVIPVNNLNTQSASLDFYFEHEITHQFWALDEFPSTNAWWVCGLTAGYFNRPNWNSTVPAPGYCRVPTVDCVMKGNYPDAFCAYTTDQVGWADLDHNGIPDLYETHAVVLPDSSQYRTSAGLAITLTGHANEKALPNRNPNQFGAGDSISIAWIDSVQYRLDSGPWVTIPCADGRCDFGEERFTLVLPPLPPGNHAVEWRAWNSNGRTAPVPSATLLTVSGASSGFPGGGGSGAPRAPRVTVAPTPARGSARLGLDATPGARGTAAIVDVTGRLVRRWAIHVPGDGRLAWQWDGRQDGGGEAAAGLYFLVVKIGPETATRRVVLIR